MEALCAVLRACVSANKVERRQAEDELLKVRLRAAAEEAALLPGCSVVLPLARAATFCARLARVSDSLARSTSLRLDTCLR